MSNKQSESNEEKDEQQIVQTNANLVYDRDDSLNDVISFGKQTPFRFGSQLIDNNNNNDDDEDEDEDDEQLSTLNAFKKQKFIDDEPGRISSIMDDLIDQDCLNNNDFLNPINKQDLTSNDMLLNLKDTTLDEIYLIPESIKKKFLQYKQEANNSNEQQQHKLIYNSDTNLTNLIETSTTKPNLIYQTPPATSRQRLSNSSSRLASVKNRNSFTYKSDSKLNSITTTSPSRIPVAKNSVASTPRRPQSRLSFTNLDPRTINSSNNLNESNAPKSSRLSQSPSNKLPIQPASIKSTSKSITQTATKSKSTKQNQSAFKYYSNKEDQIKTTNSNKQLSKTTDKNRKSPFVSINQTSNNNNNNNSNKNKLTNEDELKKPSLITSRPSTTTNLNYSVDSDESICLDNLLNNPEELKRKLKESKMEKEQLSQLQQNYLHLLEQYAEKENFIDKFRLGYNEWNNYNTNKTNQLAKVLVQTPTPEFFYQQSQQQQIKLTASNEALKGIDSAIDSYQQNSSSPFTGIVSNQKSFTPNNELALNNNASNQQQQGVFLITTSSAQDRASSSNFNLITPVAQSDSPIVDNSDENIVVETNSKLGILLQTKVLEDKMQSFVTLINEKQLTQVEQKQVFDSIKIDYENLLKNYQEVKRSDMSGVMPNELDMDIDLNKELDKMKDLLNNIVNKMSTNQIEKSSSRSELSEEFKSGGSRSSISSYDRNNNEELMGQYNRLLDVFSQSTKKTTSHNNNKNNDNQQEDTITAKMRKSSSSSSLQKQDQQQQQFQSYFPTNLQQQQQQQVKPNRKSPKRTKQQMTPSNTSSESNTTSKKFIQYKQQSDYNNRKELQQQQKQQLSNQETNNTNNLQNNNLIKQIQQQQQQEKQIFNTNNDDYETDYNDIIEVESGLLDNSFINDDDEVDEEVDDDDDDYVINELNSSFKQYANIRKANFDEQQTESEYENYNNIINDQNIIMNKKNNENRNSSSSNYKSSSSSSSCQPIQHYTKPRQIHKHDRRFQNTNQLPNENRNINKSSRTNQAIRQQKAASMHQTPSYHYDNDLVADEEEPTVLYVNDDQPQRKSTSKQMINRVNSFNPSSSSSSNSVIANNNTNTKQISKSLQKSSSSTNGSQNSLIKPIISKKQANHYNQQHQQHKRLQPVAKAYEGSESDELLESFNQFERDYESIATVKTVTNEANKRHSHQNYPLYDEINSKPPLKSSDKTKHASKHHNQHHQQQQKQQQHQQHRRFLNDAQCDLQRTESIKFDQLSEFSHSTEISGSAVELNNKKKVKSSSSSSTRTSSKAELMKQLADEVESLKQQILKKHLSKLRDNQQQQQLNLNDDKKKMKKSQSYQSYQALKDELVQQNKAKTTQSSISSNMSDRRYSQRVSNTKKTDDLKHISNSKSLDNFKKVDSREKRHYVIAKDEIKQNQTDALLQNQFGTGSSNLLCYDTQGRLVTILPNNPYFLQQTNTITNRNSFPLNEINQNIIEQQNQVKTKQQASTTFNHMQTQTQLEPTLEPTHIAPSVTAHLPVVTNLIPPQKYYAQPVYNQNVINTSNNSHHSKRRIRYYIREYADVSAASDSESTCNRLEEREEAVNEENVNLKPNGHLKVTISCNTCKSSYSQNLNHFNQQHNELTNTNELCMDMEKVNKAVEKKVFIEDKSTSK